MIVYRITHWTLEVSSEFLPKKSRTEWKEAEAYKKIKAIAGLLKGVITWFIS